jgi:dihydropteroate synthase
MAEVALAGHATVCAMHMQGTVQTMQRDPRYRDVVHEVGEWFAETIHRCVGLGLARDRLIVDPGIGFGKTLEHNLMLLRQLDAFRFLKVPVMLGTSRKSFLGAITHESVASARVVSSAVSISLAAATGAVDMVRVHDVRQTKEALLVAEAIGSASAGGERWICAEPTLEKSTGAL